MLYGMIDVGSNTIRMAIYVIDGDRIEMIMKKKHTVGLASHVREGIMMRSGIEKVVEIISEYRDFLGDLGITRITAFTTAALRNANNSQQAVDEIERRTGVKIHVMTGDEEATFDFIGATHNLIDEDGLLIDIGGGSTEIVYFKARQIKIKVSLPIGSLAFHTRYTGVHILPSSSECEEMRAEADATVSAIKEFQAVSHAQICGIGGTFKGAMALYNAMYGMPKRNVRMDVRRIGDILRRFQRENELIEPDKVLLMRTVPERMHTFMPGLIIADVLAKRFGSMNIIFSDSGVREGYIYDKIIDKNYFD
ncbi:MAG: exopolyphosphatase [Selenomonadaceae bacterium]|nr:exopolyphosphatase [Selenomonadaceae bacterium]